MPANLGAAEILVILVVALIVLGPKRLPEAGRQVGKALAEIRRWSTGVQDEIRTALDVETEPQFPPPTPPVTPADDAPAAPVPTDLQPSPVDERD